MMMKTRKLHLIILLTFVCCLLGWGNGAMAQNHFKNKRTGVEYTTFSAAYEAADAGDELVILVASVNMVSEGNGSSGNVVAINKNITISVRDDEKLGDGYATLNFSGGKKQNGIDVKAGKTLYIKGNNLNKIKIADMSNNNNRTYLFVIRGSGATLNAENVLIEGSQYGIFNTNGTVNLTSCKLGDATNTCILCNRGASTTNIKNCMIYGKAADTTAFKEPLIRPGSSTTAATLGSELDALTSTTDAHAVCVTKDPTNDNSVGTGNRIINIVGDSTRIFGFKAHAFYICYGHTVLNFKGGHIFNCHASEGASGSDYGSAIYLTRYASDQQAETPDGYPTCNMTGGTIESCYSAGGAVRLTSGASRYYMYGGVIKNNVCSGNGGGVSLHNGTMTLSGGDIIGNTASGDGGGLIVNLGTFNMSGGSIMENTASTHGGGLYLESGTFNMSGGSIMKNTAPRGGGFYVSSTTVNLNGGTIVGNTATVNGGGFSVSNNTVNVGGSGSSPLTVKGNTVNGIPHDIFLSTGRYLTVAGANFDPQDVGIFTTGDGTDDVGVLYNASGNYLSDLYTAIANGTKNVFPNQPFYKVKPYDGGSSTKKYIYFTSVTSPWSSLQQTARATDLGSPVDGYYEISNVKQLTAFLWKVNGIDTYESSFSSPAPEIKGKLMADIDMQEHYWVPIANYTGTFDGNGHSISNLIMKRSNASTQRGLFGTLAGGTVKNLQLNNCNFSSGQALYMGLVAAEQSSGNIYNCSVNGTLTGNSEPVTMGGFVGKITSGTLKNSYANIIGCTNGLVGNNGGTVENCYVRNDSGLYGTNSGSVNYCYYGPTSTSDNDGTNGTFNAVALTYTYGTFDNQVTASNSYVPSSSNKPLVKTLNNWVDAQSGTDYAHWGRATTTIINGDYPILKMPGCNAVAASSSTPEILHYGDINTLIGSYKLASNAIYLYRSATSVATNVGEGYNAKLYIDEDAAITQADAITAYVGVTLKNTQASDASSWDWHMFSPAISDAPLGINYIIGGNDQNTASGPHYGYGVEPPVYNLTGTGYFPTADEADYRKWDYYCYYEPQYHWINFKRNGPSHWHEDAPYGVHDPIDYVSDDGENVNESTMKPGKGYLLATKDETHLQCKGTLNNANVNIAVTTDGPYRKGYNFLGNPYQSYYDFNEFAEDNAALWGSDVTKASYMLLSGNSYTSYTYNASENKLAAPRCLHPHQGFMIVATNAGSATFYNTKRYIDGTSTFRDEQPNYPLVNLIATDGDGKSDITIVELGRPDKGGAVKAYDLHLGKGCLYTRYEGEDYAIAFTQPGITEVGIRFEADEEATFTMTWDIENGEFGYLHLIDNLTGTNTDCLSASEYHFNATPDDYKSRFKLVFDYTGIEENEEDGPSTGSGTFAFQMGDQLVVNGGPSTGSGTALLQMFDVTGRLMMEKTIAGAQTTTALPDLSTGVYVLLLKGTNGTQTQKIVIEK